MDVVVVVFLIYSSFWWRQQQIQSQKKTWNSFYLGLLMVIVKEIRKKLCKPQFSPLLPEIILISTQRVDLDFDEGILRSYICHLFKIANHQAVKLKVIEFNIKIRGFMKIMVHDLHYNLTFKSFLCSNKDCLN